MKKASSSFLVLFFAAVLVSFNSFAQFSMGQSETIREQVNQNLRSYERLRLSDLLRLSYQEQSNIEILSLSIMAQSLIQGPAQLELSQHGRRLTSETVRRQMKEIQMVLPARTMADGLELSAQSEIYLESITAVVNHSRIPGPGPGPGPGYEQPAQPNSLITLRVNQSVRGYTRIPLAQLARQQMGISLVGAEIERVIVQGQSSYGRSASVQVEINSRPVGQVKYLSQGQTPLPLQSMEAVQSLALLVNGDAQISEIRIRVGQVRHRPGPQLPQSQRVYVGREVSSYNQLELSSLLGYDSRLIRSITIEAQGSRYGQTQLELASRYGEIQGALFVGANSIRATIQLRRPMPAHELRLQAISSVHVSALEIQFQ